MDPISPNQESTDAPQWAVIELMGHVRYGGLVSKDNQFGTALLRVEVPQHDGSFVSQLVNPSSLYRVTICSEDIARQAALAGNFTPLNAWDVRHLLPKSMQPDLGY
ncbi:hypothetical protein JIN85_17065 [Luteolibacter pohnpeiensis]|uniref:Uncharacterized protein n=1 Tax=Luteolibacter pohnpeiensis TaxID=454153 RepID=A0A934VY35_9BACT|nr:hypothetical protein [Luteolibacter pohnpeiensis]MBK1884134.1 hypothetical protein [Luteolibacter pohnpeiensis]